MGRFLFQKIKIFLGLFFLIISVAIIALTLSQINRPKTTKSKANEVTPTPTTGFLRKKGVAGSDPFRGSFSRAYDLKIFWFYNWSYVPFWGNDPINWSVDVWRNPNLEFVPMWGKKSYLTSLGISSCMTSENQQRLYNAIVERINLICNAGYCNRNPGRYHLIGNEPDQIGADSDGINGTDLSGDAAACYGTIIRAIRSKDTTAKFIILGLSKEGALGKTNWDNYNFLNGFIFKWRQIWAGTDIANLADVISGWHLHTYYLSSYYGNSYASCPTNDSWPRNYLADIDGLMQSAFGKKVANQELWITEMGSLFNLPSRSNPTERNKFLNQMECLVNVYENSPIVTRYAWFYAGSTPNWEATSLYNSSTSSYCVQPSSGGYCLTDLGVKYASIPTSSPNSPTPTSQPTLTPTTTVTPNPSASPTSNPTATPTTITSCICLPNFSCDPSCQFNRLNNMNYFSPYKCSRETAIIGPTTSQINNNSFCQRSKRTMGDADGSGTVDEDDYLYYLRSVLKVPIPTSVNTDFNGDGIVSVSDLEIWLAGREL